MPTNFVFIATYFVLCKREPARYPDAPCPTLTTVSPRSLLQLVPCDVRICHISCTIAGALTIRRLNSRQWMGHSAADAGWSSVPASRRGPGSRSSAIVLSPLSSNIVFKSGAKDGSGNGSSGDDTLSGGSLAPFSGKVRPPLLCRPPERAHRARTPLGRPDHHRGAARHHRGARRRRRVPRRRPLLCALVCDGERGIHRQRIPPIARVPIWLGTAFCRLCSQLLPPPCTTSTVLSIPEFHITSATGLSSM
jgi:hypothetical protein